MITLRRTISLIAGMILIIAFLASACAPAATPQVLKETVVVEKEVEKVVTVEVEKEVEKVVTVEVEKVVTATPPPCPSAPAPFDEACIDWKQFSGETISVFLMPNEWQEAVQAKIPQFEDLTGIKVQMEIYPDSELWTKLSVALSAGATTPDVVPLGSFQLGTFVPTGWIEPLDTYLDNPQLTNAAWYDLEDVHKSARDHFTYNGKLYAISFDSSGAFMMYRKDLLEEAGIEVPKDFQELYEAAVALNNPPGVFGISSRGARGFDVVWAWAHWAFPYGARILDEEGQPVFCSPEGVAATEMWVKTVQDAGPPGVGTFAWYEMWDTFGGGRAAFALDATSHGGLLTSPDHSRIIDKWGVALIPTAPGGTDHSGPGWFWSVAINANSEKKEAAWMFVQWLTSPPIAKELALETARSGRTSAWDNDEFRAMAPSEQWLQVTNEVLATMDSTLMQYSHPRVQEVYDVLGLALNKALTGQEEAEPALNEACETLRDLLAQ